MNDAETVELAGRIIKGEVDYSEFSIHPDDIVKLNSEVFQQLIDTKAVRVETTKVPQNIKSPITTYVKHLQKNDAKAFLKLFRDNNVINSVWSIFKDEMPVLYDLFNID